MKNCADFAIQLVQVLMMDGDLQNFFHYDALTTMTSQLVPTGSDPLFRPLQHSAAQVSSGTNAVTLALLSQAVPVSATAQQIYTQKLEHKPLSTIPADASNARDSRRQKRNNKLKRKRKPKPLSSREKRELRIYEIDYRDVK